MSDYSDPESVPNWLRYPVLGKALGLVSTLQAYRQKFILSGGRPGSDDHSSRFGSSGRTFHRFSSHSAMSSSKTSKKASTKKLTHCVCMSPLLHPFAQTPEAQTHDLPAL